MVAGEASANEAKASTTAQNNSEKLFFVKNRKDVLHLFLMYIFSALLQEILIASWLNFDKSLTFSSRFEKK